jgi:hypothetical protein
MAYHGHSYRRGLNAEQLKERWLGFWDRMESACLRMDFGSLGLGTREDEKSATASMTRAELIGKLEKVEARLEVLERIVTGKGYDIADKIDRL